MKFGSLNRKREREERDRFPIRRTLYYRVEAWPVCTRTLCARVYARGKERREEEEEAYRVERRSSEATAANGWVSGCRVARRGRGDEEATRTRRDETRPDEIGAGERREEGEERERGKEREGEVYSRLSPVRMILNTIIII